MTGNSSSAALPDVQTRDTPRGVGRLAVTWTYRESVLDIEPQGPLPPQIYWRRRGLALGIAVALIVVVVAIVVSVVSSDSGASTTNADKPAAAQGPGVPKGPDGQPEANNIRAPGGQLPGETPTLTAAVEPPPILKEGDDCPDSTLAVKGITSAPRYTVGDQPKFAMVVTNIGLVACRRDVGAAVLAAYVYTLDNQRIWSNLDCAPSNETLVKTFAPGEQVTTTVTWTGMGSAPLCPLPRQPIGPGTYNLVVQLGNLRSATLPFILAEPSPATGLPAPPEGELPTGPVPGPGG